MQVNTVAAGPYNFVVKGKQRPFSNNFTVDKIVKVVQKYKIAFPQCDEVHCYVTCTADSKEPFMQYYCVFTGTGKLIACNN
jgi:hypothetical protein